MTTHRERVRACLRGTILDRPPVALWRHFPVDDQSAEALAEAHLAFQRTYDFDIVKVTPASSFSVRDWGVEDRWEGNVEGTRTYSKRVVHDPMDWVRLPLLGPDAPHLARQLGCLRLIRSRLEPDTPVLQTVFNPLAQAKHLAGEEILLDHLRTHPEQVQRGLETIAETTRIFIQEAANTGIDGIFYAVQHAQAHLLDRQSFIGFSRGADVMLLESAADLWCNLLHVHGEAIYFDAVSDYPAQIINWHDRDTDPSMTEACGLWPGALCGGLRRSSLVFGAAKDVEREASEILSTPARSRLILSTGCVVPIVAPHGNILAAIRGAQASAVGPVGDQGTE